MKLTIYGPGCSNCAKLADNAEVAAQDLGINYELEEVEDVAKMAEVGVMQPPALAIDGEIKVKGEVPEKDEIKDLLK